MIIWRCTKCGAASTEPDGQAFEDCDEDTIEEVEVDEEDED